MAREPEPTGRAARALAGLGGVLVLTVAFALVLGLVAARWAPLGSLDRSVVSAVNGWVSARPAVVDVLHALTDLGGTGASWVLLPTAAAWLLLRGDRATAAYVVVTGVGLGVLSWGTKALVDRLRPVVDAPVAQAPGLSFPSGHAMGATVTYGVLLLVFLPAVPRRLRGVVTAGVVSLVLVIGLTRVGLGVHYPSDVLGGWLFGVLWLAVATSSFRRWRGPDDERAVDPAPAHDAPLPHGRQAVAGLVVAGVLVWGALIGLGALLTAGLGGIGAIEAAAMRWVVGTRTGPLTDVAGVVGRLGDTGAVVAALVVGASLALAATRRWAPPVFLLLAVAGEKAMFLATVAVVDRARPPVEQLGPPAPATSSFPSGHVAAALATYGAVALLVLAWGRGPWRHAVAALAALVVLAVAWSRVYLGVHHPGDVLASLLYTSAWLAACWVMLCPGRATPPAAGSSGRTPARSPRRA